MPWSTRASADLRALQAAGESCQARGLQCAGRAAETEAAAAAAAMEESDEEDEQEPGNVVDLLR